MERTSLILCSRSRRTNSIVWYEYFSTSRSEHWLLFQQKSLNIITFSLAFLDFHCDLAIRVPQNEFVDTIQKRNLQLFSIACIIEKIYSRVLKCHSGLKSKHFLNMAISISKHRNCFSLSMLDIFALSQVLPSFKEFFFNILILSRRKSSRKST
jgi:hypothetical protein